MKTAALIIAIFLMNTALQFAIVYPLGLLGWPTLAALLISFPAGFAVSFPALRRVLYPRRTITTSPDQTGDSRP